MSTREQLLEKCGLPKYNKTSHCFSDSTHHTCCMLGPEARKYADKQSIIEFISKEPAQPSGAECLSTQEELSFFDSTHVVTVPKIYNGLKLPNSSKID
jgi:hypothetical protein